jgi:hypothetical protein
VIKWSARSALDPIRRDNQRRPIRRTERVLLRNDQPVRDVANARNRSMAAASRAKAADGADHQAADLAVQTATKCANEEQH